MNKVKSICLLGFGEVGITLAKALLNLEHAPVLSCFDLKNDQLNFQSNNQELLKQVKTFDDAAAAVREADLVISAVTAEQNLNAAKSVLAGLKVESWFLDLNSVSPKTKIEVSRLVEQSGAKYIEAAVMSPIHPLGIASPISLGGPHAEKALPILHQLGFLGASVYSAELGKAAASKMCRSVMIKGLESLLSESLITARHYGVEEAVLTSLNNLMPGIDWREHGSYMISRSLEHGVRRAEEMREVSKTVEEAGLEPRMSKACSETQAWMAEFSSLEKHGDLAAMLDSLRVQLLSKTK